MSRPPRCDPSLRKSSPSDVDRRLDLSRRHHHLSCAVVLLFRQRDRAHRLLARTLQLEKSGNTRARLVNRLVETRERMIGAILAGNNVANIAASALMTGLLYAWFGDVGVLYATAIMTVVIVVFIEVLPKTLAINTPDRVALFVARPILWLVRLLGPILVGVEALVRWILRLFGFRVGTDQAFLSAHEELRGAVDLLHHEGSVEKLDRDMLSGLLDLRDLTVSDVMIHRTEMITVCADDPPAEAVKTVLA